jgi:imidazolonepropionase
MREIDIIKDGYLTVKDGIITGFGNMSSFVPDTEPGNIIDASGKYLFPSFCDSHTHIVYAGSREREFVNRIKGMSYTEIARRGGGILNSARKLAKAPEDQLYREAMIRINEVIGMGTGAVEIKSGYGLTTETELKMLRIIRRIRENSLIEVKSTFLGAHALPAEYEDRRNEYVDLVINEMIPAVTAEGLADYIDVFCDKDFFTVEETERILMAGMKHGLKAKLHANELDFSGGVQAGIKYDALSVDHLEHTGDEEIKALLGSETMPTLLPGSVFFLGLPDPPVRKMIDAGLPVAMASDYNPGSSPSGNMKFIMSLGCIKHGMLPEEAVNAVTINSAYAMGLP